MIKVCVIGHFGYGKNLLNGQTIKTKNVTNELEKKFDAKQVMKIDTHGGVKIFPKIMFQLIKAFRVCENIIILPAHNGIKIFVPLCSMLNRFYRRKLHYIVIGGWLRELLNDHKHIEKRLKLFTGIYVETNTMKSALDSGGFKNVYVMPNFKNIRILDECEIVNNYKQPYGLCIFSRVMKEKGIETAVHIIKQINVKLGYIAYSLDIYGQVDIEQYEWFENLKKNFPSYVRYCGCVEANQSGEVLKKYFALLFPTHFYTEGIPGTLIDAFAAGVPVISAKWESYADVVDEGITGVGYEFDNIAQFEEILLEIVKNPNSLLSMKKNCIRKAKKYIPESAIQIMTEKL